ncbi:MAG: potassium/proton antiporter [Gammaproteobacteria bacterium]|uniref:potassium/proton antiporter n=1 Tax=Pseudomaricurvus alcaniphilus TaxID=1166482 RepID=UPI00140D0505|nr:potassium/proton antiporter [Pseudomaricurvus alcaniphilus]MBR9908776.1 potassium/proton antiporter [Gammaproteobacteria bacterium]NHN37872.1 potassium/proton antiporter [Pseudomaricurvus alcaniphilus]
MALELTSQYIFGGALLALLCVFASILSRRFGAPLLLVFLVLGMLAGEDGPGGIKFDDFNLAFLFGNLALAIIIFDGGLGTRRDTFRVSLRPALSLATVGVLITAALTGLAAHWILKLPWQEGLLIGAIVGSTDAAAVFGLLRSAGLELKERTGATLEIESGSNDPMAIFLTLTLVQVMTLGDGDFGWPLLTELARQMGLGLVGGLAGGYLLALLLQRLNLAVSMYPLLAMAGGLSVFGVTNLGGGSGFLAIYIVGVMIGNKPLPYGSDIHRFHDGMAWLSQIGMFLMLGLLITPSNLPPIILPAIAIAAVLIFVARPLAVLLSLLPFRFPWREQVFIGWCGLRGAVPIILALFPSLAGMEHTKTYFELVFFVVFISLVLQGWTIAPLARWLQIELPPPAREPQHLVLKIPQYQDKEILVYEAVPGSAAVGKKCKYLPLSDGAQLVGVVRQGIMLEDSQQQTLQAHDQALILAATGTSAALNRLFALSAPTPRLDSAVFFGEFIIQPQSRLAELSQLYGFTVEEKYQQLTIAELIREKFNGKPVIGDRVKLGSVQFVVREFKGDEITAVGLKLGQSGPG